MSDQSERRWGQAALLLVGGVWMGITAGVLVFRHGLLFGALFYAAASVVAFGLAAERLNIVEAGGTLVPMPKGSPSQDPRPSPPWIWILAWLALGVLAVQDVVSDDTAAWLRLLALIALPFVGYLVVDGLRERLHHRSRARGGG